MQTEAFERSLRAFVRRHPFQPLTVELTSGTRFQVLHPEALLSTVDWRFISEQTARRVCSIMKALVS